MLDYLKAEDESQDQWLDDEYFYEEWLRTQQITNQNTLQI